MKFRPRVRRAEMRLPVGSCRANRRWVSRDFLVATCGASMLFALQTLKWQFSFFSISTSALQQRFERRQFLLTSIAPIASSTLAVATAGADDMGDAAVEKAKSSGALEPTADDLASVKAAYAALAADPSRPGARVELLIAEDLFGRAIQRWEGPLHGTRRDRTQLRLGRAQVRITINDIAGGKLPEKAEDAVEDLDEVVRVMEENMDEIRGTFDYPDVFVRRALAKEEIAYGRKDPKQWSRAVEDYTRAVQLWRSAPPSESNGLGVNPLVLNFRGNALSQARRFEEAIEDYREAGDIFTKNGELRQASLSRSNEALALFGAGRNVEAISKMESIVRRDPGVTDAHVALAAAYWANGEMGRAEGEWSFACEKIDAGCKQYKDLEWVLEIRRWPSNLVANLQTFFKGEAPNAVLAG